MSTCTLQARHQPLSWGGGGGFPWQVDLLTGGGLAYLDGKICVYERYFAGSSHNGIFERKTQYTLEINHEQHVIGMRSRTCVDLHACVCNKIKWHQSHGPRRCAGGGVWTPWLQACIGMCSRHDVIVDWVMFG